MDTTENHSPATRIDELQELILSIQNAIEEMEGRKKQVRFNLSLNAKEQTILNIGLDISIVKAQRNLNRAKSMQATLKMEFMKRTFWNTI